MGKFEATTGEVMESRDFWAFVDARRIAGNGLHWVRGAFTADDGTWYFPDDMPEGKREECRRAHAESTWWLEHKRDVSVIPSLSDSALVTFRLCADIRADIPVMNAATDELWRRGIRDYPVAV